ncbi:MAG: PolC-type DNA polymerase III [Candidatus Margulisiibacteriota bacterium]
MTVSFPLRRSCPTCRQLGTVSVHAEGLSCSACDFEASFLCPICDHDVQVLGDVAQCTDCRSKTPLKKIAYLIDNGLIVDHDLRCTTCNGPTIHRPQMNLASRCYFYPNCSGQTDLFSQKRESFVFLDFETTGLEAARDDIIEIGAVKLDEEGYEHTFQTFVKPSQDIDARITGITGITNEMVAGAPSLKDSMAQLMDFVGASSLVAHNADFDMMWLVSSLLQLQMPLPKVEVICTFKWAKKLGEPHCSLGALSKKYKISHQNAHRALADAAATKEVFFIFENYRRVARPVVPIGGYLEASLKMVKRYEAFAQA